MINLSRYQYSFKELISFNKYFFIYETDVKFMITYFKKILSTNYDMLVNEGHIAKLR